MKLYIGRLLIIRHGGYDGRKDDTMMYFDRYDNSSLEKMDILFEADGIGVWVENGVLYEADDANMSEFDDTPENRAACVEDARRTVDEWNR